MVLGIGIIHGLRYRYNVLSMVLGIGINIIHGLR